MHVVTVLALAGALLLWFRRPLPGRRATLVDAPCVECNVVLVSLDTLRADHLGAYGYDKPTSPCIDRFARDAVVFEQAFGQSTWTLPSHVSMFTSLHPAGHGVTSKDRRLGPAHPTLAEVFAEYGYQTAASMGRGGGSTKSSRT